MKTDLRLGKLLIAAAVLLGLLSLAIGLVGYLLGWNDTGGSMIHSNVVPYALFSGVGLPLLAAALALARWPEVLPRFRVVPGIVALSLVALFFVGLYVRQVMGLIAIRADLDNWSESWFIDHIIRFRVGQPQFTSPQDANASAYTPGAPLLTYAIAHALGRPTSVPFYREIQQLYLVLAALFAAAAARELLRLSRPSRSAERVWLLFWIPFLYLIATNPTTNVFVHTLHNDALALAVGALAFWLLVKYCATEGNRWLVAMAVIPAVAYLVKQKEAIWAALYVLYLVLDGRLHWRRILLFGASALSLVVLSMGLCYALWGQAYYFWTLESLTAKHIWLTKALEQLTNSGWYVVMGLLGGAVLLRGQAARRLLPVWLCWLFLLLSETLTSGISYRPAHLGPASLLAAVWFVVAIAHLWPEPGESGHIADQSGPWLRAVLVVGGVTILLLSCGLFRRGSVVPEDMDRYLAQIEGEFAGVKHDRVLLDYGSWVYLPENIVMKDRAGSILVLREFGTRDFSSTIARIRQKRYDKIIMRRLGEGDAEGQSISMDPGIRQALLENYQEVRVIQKPRVPTGWLYPFLIPDRSVLEPRPETATSNRGTSSRGVVAKSGPTRTG